MFEQAVFAVQNQQGFEQLSSRIEAAFAANRADLFLAFESTDQHCKLERETGLEPATNSLEGCDSTTELLPQNPAVSYQPSAFSPPTQSLEPMIRIELMTSPLPRECSTN